MRSEDRGQGEASEKRDPLAEREAAEAAREAGGVGGRREGPDTPEHASDEHGGGEAEGFEQAEEALREHAEHAEPGGDPLADRPEPEPERDGAAHGEADQVRSTETEADSTAPEHAEDPDRAERLGGDG